MLKGGSGIRNTSPKEMLKILDEKFKTLKPAQIQETSKAVTEWQFDVSQRLEPQLSDLKRNLRILEENGQRKPSNEIIGIVKGQLMQHPIAFNTAIVFWEMTNSTAAAQTVDSFLTAMIICDNTRTTTATTGSTGLSNAAIGSITPATIQQMLAAAVAEIQQQQKFQGGTRRPRAPARKLPSLAETTGLHYCFSHGYGNHIGKECDTPKDGHDRDATGPTKDTGCTRVYKKRN